MMPEPDPIGLLDAAEEIFGFMPFELPPALPAMAAAFAMILTRVSNGECDSCTCEVCKDLRVMVETAEREMP